MNKKSWGFLAVGLLFSVFGRGAFSLAGSILILAMVLFSCFQSGVEALQSFKTAVPLYRSLFKTATFLIFTLVTIWLLVLPLVPYDTWFVGAPDREWAENLQAHCVETTQLDPQDVAFQNAIIDAIGDRRIVGLGESYHWTSEYSTTKTEIIKSLHEQAGFDVVLFESPMAPLFLALEQMKNEGDAKTGADGLFTCWRTPEVVALFEYVLASQQTDRPLQIFGYDRQHFRRDFKDADVLLRRTLLKLDPAILGEYETGLTQWGEVFERRKGRDPADPTVSDGVAFFKRLASAIRAHLAEGLPEEKDSYLELNLAAMVAEGMADDLLGQTLEGKERYLLRDQSMARNIIEISDRLLPDQKIVVWAHNAHLWLRPAKHEFFAWDPFGQFEYRMKYGKEPLSPNMGQNLKDHFDTDLYVMGFLGVGGRVGTFWGSDRRVRHHRPDSLERILRPRSGAASFLNLAKGELEAEASRVTIRTNRVQWRRVVASEQFDGVIVIDSLNPPQRF